jgi:hypothetical protein
MSVRQPTFPEDLLLHDAFVRGLARQLLGDPDRADEVAQETWLAVAAALGTTDATLLLFGPAGQPSLGTLVGPVSPARLWIPEGTRALRVVDVEGAARDFVVPLREHAAIEID